MSDFRLRGHIVTWLALLVLLAISAASSQLHLGIFNVITNFGIAAIKTALVLVVFMRIVQSAPMVRVVAAAAVLWLLLLFGLGLGDFLARGFT